MIKIKFAAIFTLISLAISMLGQSNFKYDLTLVPISIPNMPGLHSYAYAQYQGKWLIIGGRTDGLHARQPFSSFPATANNTDIYVVDVATNQFWFSSVNSLPSNLKEQLQSTNMNFHQEDDTLYIIGGYGFSATANDHITYSNLTTVHVSGLINAIQNSQPIGSFFKQIQDSIFTVTGGHLTNLNGIFYLVGGHKFMGRYNPMGNPTYQQEYTNQIRKFSINNSGSQLSFGNYTSITDPQHLRRRDYNLLEQIFPDGSQGFTISSGVFQSTTDLPFLYPVDITENQHIARINFNQYLSNYHSAVANMYDSINNEMHSIFFGGMSQYYYENGNLVQDNTVPFVKTISRITRDANGNLTEYKLPIEMPALKGASAEFIPNTILPHYTNEVLKMNQVNQSSYKIGHIFGGIESPTISPFTNNQTSTTQADPTIYEVWLTYNPNANLETKIELINPYDFMVFPNPIENEFNIKFYAEKPVIYSYTITNSMGQIIRENINQTMLEGENLVTIQLDKTYSGLLFLTVVIDHKYIITKKLSSKIK